MLKFFTARDDENESLLGAITEGKTFDCSENTGVGMRLLPFIACARALVCVCVCATEKKNADITLGCAHRPHHLKSACAYVCVLRTFA